MLLGVRFSQFDDPLDLDVPCKFAALLSAPDPSVEAAPQQQSTWRFHPAFP
jgi:hypothetical protein